MSLEIIPLKSLGIIGFGEQVYDAFLGALHASNHQIMDNDIVVITSKIYSMQEKTAVLLDEVQAGKRADDLAKETGIDPKVVQLILDEAKGEVYGTVPHAILTKTEYGLSSNAGIDLSNAPEGYALLLPRQANQLADIFRKRIKEDKDKDIAVVITDSRTVPLRRGAMAVAIGYSGIEPVSDERGKKDLYGYTMSMSSRAIADNVSSAASLVMGETNEQIPFSIVRGLSYQSTEHPKSPEIAAKYCLYYGPLSRLMSKYSEINEE